MSALLLAGCTHKDIVCPYEETRVVRVSFEWDRASGADPAGMTIYFYPLGEGGQVWRFDVAGRDGGEVELPIGRYRMLAVNNDLPGLTFTGQNGYQTLTATTRELDQSYVCPTGMLYSGKVDEAEVTLCGVSYITEEGSLKECPVGVIRCWPDSMATVYTVNVEEIRGIERVRSVSMVLEGLAAQKYIYSDEAEGAASLLTQAEIDRRGSGAFHTVTTGLGSPAEGGETFLTVIGTKTDGLIFKKSFNVTDQVSNSPNPLNVLINIKGLTIAENDSTQTTDPDVGMTVGVDGWEEETIILDNNNLL